MLPESDTSNIEALRHLAIFAEQAEDIHALWQEILDPLNLGLGGFVVGVGPLLDKAKNTCDGMWCGWGHCMPCSCTPCDCSASCGWLGTGPAEDELRKWLEQFNDQVQDILPKWDAVLAERGLRLNVRGFMVTGREQSWNASQQGWRVDMDDAGPCIRAPEIQFQVVGDARAVPGASCC